MGGLEAYLPQLLTFVAGVVVPAVLAKFNIKVPVIVPTPSVPAPVNPDTPSSVVAAIVEWAIRALAGGIVSAADKKALATLKPLVDKILDDK